MKLFSLLARKIYLVLFFYAQNIEKCKFQIIRLIRKFPQIFSNIYSYEFIESLFSRQMTLLDFYGFTSLLSCVWMNDRKNKIFFKKRNSLNVPIISTWKHRLEMEYCLQQNKMLKTRSQFPDLLLRFILKENKGRCFTTEASKKRILIKLQHLTMCKCICYTDGLQ